MGHWSRSLRVDTLSLEGNGIAPGDLLDIELGPELFLHKQLAVPLAARASLSKVVDLNMRQSLPGGGENLVWQYTIEERGKSGLRLGIYLIKKETLQRIAEAVTLKEGAVRTIGIAGVRTKTPLMDNRSTVDRPRRFWDASVVLLLVIAVGLVFFQGFQARAELRKQISLFEQQREELNQSTFELRGQLDAETSSHATIGRDVALFLSEHQRLPIILDLTETLDEETWVSELIVSGSKLVISGFTSGEVIDVMESLTSLPWVARVNLEGPVTFDTLSRKDRFDLSILIHASGSVVN